MRGCGRAAPACAICLQHTLTNWLESCGRCCTARKLCSDLSHIICLCKERVTPSKLFHLVEALRVAVLCIKSSGLYSLVAAGASISSIEYGKGKGTLRLCTRVGATSTTCVGGKRTAAESATFGRPPNVRSICVISLVTKRALGNLCTMVPW